MFTHLFFDFLHLHTYSHNTDSATILLTMQSNLSWHRPSPEVSKFMNDGECSFPLVHDVPGKRVLLIFIAASSAEHNNKFY